MPNYFPLLLWTPWNPCDFTRGIVSPRDMPAADECAGFCRNHLRIAVGLWNGQEEAMMNAAWAGGFVSSHF